MRKSISAIVIVIILLSNLTLFVFGCKKIQEPTTPIDVIYLDIARLLFGQIKITLTLTFRSNAVIYLTYCSNNKQILRIF
jgi:hypothetical protein